MLFGRLTPHQLYALRFGEPARPTAAAAAEGLGDPLAELAAANRERAKRGLPPFAPSWFLTGGPRG